MVAWCSFTEDQWEAFLASEWENFAVCNYDLEAVDCLAMTSIGDTYNPIRAVQALPQRAAATEIAS